MLTFPVAGTFQRKAALLFQMPVQSDFFADGGIVLADRISHAGFGGSVPDSGFNDLPVFQSQMRVVRHGSDPQKETDIFRNQVTFFFIGLE